MRTALALSGLDPHQLILEITESVLMEDPERAEPRPARAPGDRASGSPWTTSEPGYSSLSHLQRFPVDVLKIDKSFIDPLVGSDPASSALVTAIIGLARSLGLEVIAEGIEHESQLHRLVDLGCDMGQGFLMARPLDRDDADSVIADSRIDRGDDLIRHEPGDDNSPLPAWSGRGATARVGEPSDDHVQTEFTAIELLADHDIVEPLIADGVRCHGGFDRQGPYVSPRTKNRWPAIQAWEEQQAVPVRHAHPRRPPRHLARELPQRRAVEVPAPPGRPRTDHQPPSPASATVEGFGGMLRLARPSPSSPGCFEEDDRRHGHRPHRRRAVRGPRPRRGRVTATWPATTGCGSWPGTSPSSTR